MDRNEKEWLEKDQVWKTDVAMGLFKFRDESLHLFWGFGLLQTVLLAMILWRVW